MLLTPVVAAAATSTLVSPRPMVYACARLANSASLLLPVSNLTNLLALPVAPARCRSSASRVLMAPVWLAVIAVEYVGHRLFFAARPGARPGGDRPARGDVPLPVVPLVLVGLMLVGVRGPLPARRRAGLGGRRRGRARSAATRCPGAAWTCATVGRATHLSFAIFVLCLGVVVAGLTDTFLGDLVARRWCPDGDGLGALLVIALLATVLANVVNNLPATLLLVPLVAPLGRDRGDGRADRARRRVGPDLHRLAGEPAVAAHADPARRARPRRATFHLLSALVTLPAVLVAVVVLWAWAPLVG